MPSAQIDFIKVSNREARAAFAAHAWTLKNKKAPAMFLMDFSPNTFLHHFLHCIKMMKASADISHCSVPLFELGRSAQTLFSKMCESTQVTGLVSGQRSLKQSQI